MRRLILVAGLALALVFPGTALSASGGSDLPVIGWATGTCHLNVVTGEGDCVSTGPISHLGWTITEQEFQNVPTGPTTMRFTGTWTSTAANGDQMFGTSSGTHSTSDGVHFTTVGTWVATGGTGRLAGASLTMDGTAHASWLSVEGAIATQDVEVTLVGTLSH